MMPWHDARIVANGCAVKENFAAWFGKSKMISAALEPMVVYHGTAVDFDTFQPGAYFTQDPWQAADYAENQADAKGGAARIVPVYLRLVSPAVVDDDYIEWARL